MAWLDTQIQKFLLAENQLLHALILFVLLDYITGVCVAIQKKELSSQIGAKGITRKVAIFVVIALCHILDSYLSSSTDSPLEVVATVFYLSNEGISILENATQLGVPFPEKLANVLRNLKHKDK